MSLLACIYSPISNDSERKKPIIYFRFNKILLSWIVTNEMFPLVSKRSYGVGNAIINVEFHY